MISINATFLAELVSFTLFVLFTRSFIWPAIDKLLSERRERINQHLFSIKKQEELILASKKESERIINEAKTQALQVIEETKNRCLDLNYAAKKKAEIVKKEIIDSARVSAALEAQKINKKIMEEAMSIAKNYAELILKRSIDEKDDDQLIRDVVSKI